MSIRHAVKWIFLAVLGGLVVPVHAYAQPSQAQLDAWSAELIRYCTPEIRRYTRLSLEEGRRAIAEANRGRKPGDGASIFNERNAHEQIKLLIENRVHFSVAHIYRSDIKLIHGQAATQTKPKSPGAMAADQADKDVQYCVRSRLIELEFPDYTRW